MEARRLPSCYPPGGAPAVVPPSVPSGGTLALQPVGVVVGLGDPESVQHHRELSRYCDRCPLLRVLPAPRRDRLTVPAQVAISCEWAQDVARSTDQVLA